MVVVIWVDREVVPWPFNCDCVFSPARFASAPVALVGPATAEILLFKVDWRCVLVVPCATAEAVSETTTVTRSSTWLARTSLPRSIRCEEGAHNEPGVNPEIEPARASASLMYSSRGLGCGGFLAFLPAVRTAGVQTRTANTNT